jgi:hypothetical protein
MGIATAVGARLICGCLAASEVCPVHPKKPHCPEEKDGGLTVLDLAYEARQAAVTTGVPAGLDESYYIVGPNTVAFMPRYGQYMFHNEGF